MTASRPLVVVIEDDPSVRRFLATALAERHRVLTAAEGEEGLRLARRERPDLVILDLGLPDGDGLTLIPRLKGFVRCPIIVLSARDAEADKVAALDAGADDYLVKPFGADELEARLRVAQRHANRIAGEQASAIEAGDLAIDLAARTVLRGGKPVHLTPNEHRLLAMLVREHGRVVTHRRLMAEVWGPSRVEHTHYLRIYMAQLRAKLEDDPAQPRHLLTDLGVGYRFVVDAER